MLSMANSALAVALAPDEPSLFAVKFTATRFCHSGGKPNVWKFVLPSSLKVATTVPPPSSAPTTLTVVALGGAPRAARAASLWVSLFRSIVDNENVVPGDVTMTPPLFSLDATRNTVPLPTGVTPKSGKGGPVGLPTRKRLPSLLLRIAVKARPPLLRKFPCGLLAAFG